MKLVTFVAGTAAPRAGALMDDLQTISDLTVFAIMGTNFAVAGALPNGLALGSEIDIVGYRTACIFGNCAYGRLHGAVLFGAALSPLGYAYTYQAFGSYLTALLLAAASLTAAPLLLMILPRLAAPVPSLIKEAT